MRLDEYRRADLFYSLVIELAALKTAPTDEQLHAELEETAVMVRFLAPEITLTLTPELHIYYRSAHSPDCQIQNAS